MSLLCHPCWSVMCVHPWPADDSAHGGSAGGGFRPDIANDSRKGIPSFYENKGLFEIDTMDLSQAGTSTGTVPRRSYSMANIQNSTKHKRGFPVPSTTDAHHGRGWHVKRQPASMPEAPSILGSSSGDPRWGALAATVQVAGTSAPCWPQSMRRCGSVRNDVDGPIHGHLDALRQLLPSPVLASVDMGNMLDVESLELFESQSHLFDPDSRLALHRQRQLLQWQNCQKDSPHLEPMLERQDSAGSGADDAERHNRAFVQCGPKTEEYLNGSGQRGMPVRSIGLDGGGATSTLESGCSRDDIDEEAGDSEANSGQKGHEVVHELREARRHLAMVQKECEVLTTRVHQLEAELATQRESAMCKICHEVWNLKRNMARLVVIRMYLFIYKRLNKVTVLFPFCRLLGIVWRFLAFTLRHVMVVSRNIAWMHCVARCAVLL